MIVQPVAVLVDVIPILGTILEAGMSIVCGLLALSVSTLVIAVSWLVFRPMFSLVLVVVVGGVSYAIWKYNRDQKVMSSEQPVVVAEAEVYVPSAHVDGYPTESKPLLK